MDSLIDARRLAELHRSEDAIILDASLHLPAARRDANAEFVRGHIPGARFLDLASLADPEADAPAAVPNLGQFAERLASLGIAPGNHVVLYDDSTLRTSARGWFIFRLYGWRDVAILDGGLGAWRAAGLPLAEGEVSVARSSLTVDDLRRENNALRDKRQMLANLDHRREQVVDARDTDRFTGRSVDTVHHLPGGHVPGARNLPFTRLLTEDGKFRPPAELRAEFARVAIDLDAPLTGTCGSGVTASVVLFAAHLLGQDGALYDGSWMDWGSDPAMPKELGEAV
jgi:thiosulfate/3-mercaptopyruvate sulfurtransferase